MVWSSVLCSDDAKQDTLDDAELGVVFLVESPYTASDTGALDCLGLQH